MKSGFPRWTSCKKNLGGHLDSAFARAAGAARSMPHIWVSGEGRSAFTVMSTTFTTSPETARKAPGPSFTTKLTAASVSKALRSRLYDVRFVHACGKTSWKDPPGDVSSQHLRRNDVARSSLPSA